MSADETDLVVPHDPDDPREAAGAAAIGALRAEQQMAQRTKHSPPPDAADSLWGKERTPQHRPPGYMDFSD